ncbi:hypothetical protein CRM22_001240 [Opisthorchis felineus]|uniref:Serpin domain-containing protein n=1 Tax=Opisthorchis felineus TaxID=147828 RepID=A0A4S2MBJ1_OPIFE|nr:hypothetical protein CRM22_001240 [Opisthorchis felineus]
MNNGDPVRKSICGFTADFYGKLTDDQVAIIPNVVVSPFSIYTAMAMTIAGTGGHTRAETLGVLGIPILLWASKPHERIGALVHKLIASSKSLDAFMANRLFVMSAAAIQTNYTRVLTDHYDSACEVLGEFPSNEAKRNHMNDWVSLISHQKIMELLPKDANLSENTVKILSILCFKACWEPAFKIIHPSELEFFGLDGIKKPCVPLYAMANVMYAILPKYEAELLRIPLKDAGWEMLLLVPKTNGGLVRLLLRLRKPGELSGLLNESPAIRPMHVYLPKFRLTQTAPLNAEKTLKKCGVISLFDARTADLSEMCSDVRLSVADVVHRVTFEIEEPITCELTSEAAEKNLGDAKLTGATIRVQRPFFFAVVCDKNIPLLVGHVTTPAES